jgi:hypothetical protein
MRITQAEAELERLPSGPRLDRDVDAAGSSARALDLLGARKGRRGQRVPGCVEVVVDEPSAARIREERHADPDDPSPATSSSGTNAVQRDRAW